MKIEGLKYIFVLVEFKHTEFFSSYRDCLLNTKLLVPSVGFSVAGLDHTQFKFNLPQWWCIILLQANISQCEKVKDWQQNFPMTTWKRVKCLESFDGDSQRIRWRNLSWTCCLFPSVRVDLNAILSRPTEFVSILNCFGVISD